MRTRSGPPSLDPDFVACQVARAFSGQVPEQVRGQKAAVQKALTHPFAVISGGPGTGKTHVTRLIRQILKEYAQKNNSPPLRILCLAPTGKAASRLENGVTIHLALKPLPSRPGFFHGADNPLKVDVVIVDEASMIDLALMSRLIEAIPLTARVILLGDKNQLSPVQAGAVFNEICQVKALAPCLALLDFNFRSQGKTGIGRLARAIHINDAAGAEQVLTSDVYPDIAFEEISGLGDLQAVMEKYVTSGYGPLAASQTLERALAQMDRFRILCAHNRGESGTLQINHLCEKILRSSPDFDIKNPFFERIIMIRINDYPRELFNGDTGIVYQEGGITKAGFTDGQRIIRQFRYSDLPGHDPAFAVTIHKSQGSEFDQVLIVLPEKPSPVVTRQLLYTGVTRAKKRAVIAGKKAVIRDAMAVDLCKKSHLSVQLAREMASAE
jgi:exodeoxyribonuclease V alpha subunit